MYLFTNLLQHSENERNFVTNSYVSNMIYIIKNAMFPLGTYIICITVLKHMKQFSKLNQM